MLVSAVLVPVTPAGAHQSYTVQPGDTLSHIAIRTGSTIAALSSENGITDPGRIRTGQVLQIPTRAAGVPAAVPTPAPVAVAGGQTYTIQPGDTLGQIAIQLGVRRADLISVNGISDANRIRSGQSLKVPGAAAPISAGVGGQLTNLLQAVEADPAKLALIPIFQKWADANNIPADLLMAVAWHESGWNNQVISSKGAVGIGQIMPPTREWVATDLIGKPELDSAIPEDNIRMSARFLAWLIKYHQSEELAIASYFQGPGNTDAGRFFEATELYVASVQAHRKFFVAS